MLEDWGRQGVTFCASVLSAWGILKFFGARELQRIDSAVEKVNAAADGEKTTEAIDKCIDRLNAIDSTKADRHEIAQAIAKIEATLEKHETSRAKMYGRIDNLVSEMHTTDSKLAELIGEFRGLRSAMKIAPTSRATPTASASD